MNDIEQRLAAMNEEEAKNCLRELVEALHAEDTDRAYSALREWNLEVDDKDMP